MTGDKSVKQMPASTTWRMKADGDGRCAKTEKPNIANGKPVTMKLNPFLNVRLEFQREPAREGACVRVWGTHPGSAQSELVPNTFWLANGLQMDRCYHAERHGRTEPKVVETGNAEHYERLRIDADGVRKAMMRVNFIRRLIVRSAIKPEDETWQKTTAA